MAGECGNDVIAEVTLDKSALGSSSGGLSMEGALERLALSKVLRANDAAYERIQHDATAHSEIDLRDGQIVVQFVTERPCL